MKRNRFPLLLVLLLTAVTGTWAQQQQLKVKEITVEMATPWLDDDGSTVLSESHLPTFYPVTEEEAMAWAEVTHIMECTSPQRAIVLMFSTTVPQVVFGQLRPTMPVMVTAF